MLPVHRVLRPSSRTRGICPEFGRAVFCTRSHRLAARLLRDITFHGHPVDRVGFDLGGVSGRHHPLPARADFAHACPHVPLNLTSTRGSFVYLRFQRSCILRVLFARLFALKVSELPCKAHRRGTHTVLKMKLTSPYSNTISHP